MGGVTSSQADFASPLFLKSPSRFFISTFVASTPTNPPVQPHPERHIIGTPGGPSLILPNHSSFLQSTIDPSSLAISTQSLDPKRLIEYIQDPDSKAILLKLPADSVLKFKISIQTSSLPINNLTFIAAPSCSSLDNLLVNEFLENPNIQNEENVVLLGDYCTEQSSGTSFEFVWKTSPPLTSPLFKSDERGMKLVLCFAEYDKRDHSLKQLARFSVWIEAPATSTTTLPPKINTALEPLPELIESPILSNASSPLLRDSASPNGVAPFYFPPHPLTHDINRLTLSRSGSPIMASRNTSHSTPPPPNFPAPAIPSPDLPALDVSNTTNSTTPTSIPATKQSSEPPSVPSSELPSVSSMLLPETEHEILDSREKKPTSAIPRPHENSTSQPEDGPLFRATIAALEKKTGLLKIKVKKLLKRSMMVHERQTSLVEAHVLFLQSIQEIADSEIPSFRPLVHNFFHSKHNGPYVTIDFLRKSASDLHLHVIDPLRRLYDQEIKSFDQRKRDFDDESREYYAWLSRYLSVKQEAKGKKKSDSDSKYAERRKAFELRRFDYYSYIQDLHGGRKQQLVTYNLALFAELELNRYIAAGEKLNSEFQDDLNAFVSEIKDVNKEWTRQRTEREVYRRAIERSTKDSHFSQAMLATSPTSEGYKHFNPAAEESVYSLLENSASLQSPVTVANSASPINAMSATTGSTSATTQPASSHSSASSAPSKSVEALRLQSPVNNLPVGSPEKSTLSPSVEPHSDIHAKATEKLESTRRKEGLLWAMSRPGGFNDPINLNKAGGWHKFWVVLAAGKLCEYTNWKQGLDLHNDPINLKVALVREARNAERRFCFEVVTPNYKRVYQATTEDDMQNWIRAINNGISSSLEGSSQSIKDFSMSSSEQSTLRPVQSSLDSHVSPVTTKSHFSEDHSSHDYSRSSGGNFDPNNLSDLKEEFAKINSRKVSLHRRTSTQKNVSEKSNLAPYKSIKAPKTLSDHSSPTSTKLPTTSRLNELVYSLDPSNRYCADCGMSNKVEWISINLLVILCIDCSGVHRSLGSHISKIRSLTLDTVSFTPELIDLIKSVNNSVINSIWEAKLGHPKNPSHIAENRAAFIREKYIEKKYVQILDRPNAYLRTAVQQKDVIGILKALASRANTNTIINTNDTKPGSMPLSQSGSSPNNNEESMIMYALRMAPSTCTSFPIVELLILNTAELQPSLYNPASANLSPAAKQYLTRKISPKASTSGSSAGSISIHASNSASNSSHVISSSAPSASTAMISSGKEDKKGGSKFQKRLSFGNSSRA